MELTVINVFALLEQLVNGVMLASITAPANLVLMVQHATTFKVSMHIAEPNSIMDYLGAFTKSSVICYIVKLIILQFHKIHLSLIYDCNMPTQHCWAQHVL